MDMMIGVGFGEAYVTKNGVHVYDQPLDAKGWEDYWTTQDAENMAVLESEAEWKIVLHGPLAGSTYQRYGVNLWRMIDSKEFENNS